ncbi:MAG: hypothetical protein BGO49_21640 [Planctomycetales bacterium 71-10]|nr:MAG: hypothetical protein BGO49_21640 [Planctomycetales bacterium 71-10]
METNLHRSLKERHGPTAGGRCEVSVDGFRIDAVAADGTLVEIQSGGLGALRPKLRSLLPRHRIRVVKPIALSRVVVRRASADGPDLSRRRSPRRGSLIEAFEDLVGLAPLLPDPNLSVEILGVAIEEVRVPRRRRPGFSVVDRRLLDVREAVIIDSVDDLWALLPVDFPRFEPFSTADLARDLGTARPFAQRVAYCLRCAGAAQSVAKRGNSYIYTARTGIVAVK